MWEAPGTINLPAWQIDYLLKPLLAQAIAAPIRIQGSLDKPHYYPDIKATIIENLKTPGRVSDTVQGLGKNLLGDKGLGGLLR